MIDVLVVGGGPAGLSAALALSRARREVVVVDAGDPRNAVAPHGHGVLGHDGLPPTELLARGRAEVAGYGGRFVEGRATSARLDGETIVVSTPEGALATRRLLVTTGLRDVLPDVPGVAEQWGRGVVVCPYCDGWERRHEVIGILATSPSGVEQAQLLRQWSDRIVYFSNDVGGPDEDAARALAARGIRVEPGRVRRLLVEDDRVAGIETESGVVPVGAVFTGPTPVPRDEVLRSLGAATHATPFGDWVTVDADGRTSVPHVWAAGNVVDVRANVPVSLGQGALIAGAINADLVAADVAAALTG